MPFCAQCGKEIEPEARFCANCGAQTNSNNKTPVFTPQVVARRPVAFIFITLIFIFVAGLVYVALNFGTWQRISKAKELIKMDTFDNAITVLDEEIKNNPRNAEAYYLKGLTYLRKDGIKWVRDSNASADANVSARELS